jgi:hypothetical protein
MERLALEYAERITYTDQKVDDDAFFARLKQHFTEAQIVELTAAVALETSAASSIRRSALRRMASAWCRSGADRKPLARVGEAHLIRLTARPKASLRIFATASRIARPLTSQRPACAQSRKACAGARCMDMRTPHCRDRAVGSPICMSSWRRRSCATRPRSTSVLARSRRWRARSGTRRALIFPAWRAGFRRPCPRRCGGVLIGDYGRRGISPLLPPAYPDVAGPH